MKHRRVLVAAVIVVAIAALVLIEQRERRRAAPRVATPAGVPSPAPPAAPRPPPAQREIRPADQPPLQRLKQEYENYRKASIYPHWSIPLTADMDFALAWNAAVTEDLHLDPDGTMARFDGSAGRVFTGEPYRAWIEAWRVVDGVRQPLAVTVRRAAVSVTSGAAIGEAFEVRFRDDGQDGDVTPGDGVVTTRFVPSEKAELARATMARIDAYVEIDGTPRHLVRDFVFAPRDVIEVIGARDQLRDGGLVATLDCEVLEDGLYTFYGNLVGADDVPIAMTKLSYRLKAGRRTADLVFFGKVIRDRGVDGPYRIADLHGLKRGEDDEHDVWWQHPRPIDTQAYRATEFSDAEWDDAERRERLSNFERVIREMETQGPPPR